jgi:hypothetical protein
MYVERRLRHFKLPELVELAGKVTDVYDDEALDRLLTLAEAGGVRGEMKNLIFAPLSPKPENRAERRDQQRPAAQLQPWRRPGLQPAAGAGARCRGPR